MKPALHSLGLDVAKLKFDVNVRLLADPQERRAASFTNDLRGFEQLRAWLRKHGITDSSQVHACLESTSRYGDALARFLYRHGFQVSVVNPRRTRNYADSQLTRTINDTIDARLIADFCASERATLRLWEPLSEDHAQLRELTRARQALVQQRDAFGNLLETATGLPRKIYQKQFRALDRQIKQLEKLIQTFTQEVLHPEFRKQIELAESIPGVGFITAATVLAELPPIDKIPQAAQAVALFGLDPFNKTSGQIVEARARLSRMGSHYGRRALYMPALCALRFNPIIRDLGLRLKAKGRKGKYLVVAAMRKLLRLIFGVVKQAKPFDPNWTNPTAPQSKQPSVQAVAPAL